MTLTFDQVLAEQNSTKGWIERFITNTDKTNKDTHSLGYLGNRVTLLKDYWASFGKTHRSLIRFKEFAESTYNKEETYDTVSEAYLVNLTELETRIQKLQGQPSTSTLGANDTSTNSAAAISNSILRHIQLPKLSLPTFDGDPLQWESFRDLFMAMLMREGSGSSEVEKMLYLKDSLVGEAKNFIGNTPVNNTSFAGAWEDLEARYGNPRILSAFHMHYLFTIPKAEKPNPNEIKRLIDGFRQAIRAFQSLKKPVSHWDEFFVYLLVQKIDRSTKIAWETSLKDSKEIPVTHPLQNGH